MKKYFILFYLLITILNSTESMAANTKNVDELLAEISVFCEKKQITDTDLPELEYQLNNVLVLENLDYSRLGPELMMHSYLKNKKTYHQIFLKFKSEQKAILNEIFNNLERLNKDGNG